MSDLGMELSKVLYREEPKTKVGDTLYRFDGNRRVYRREDDGRATGGPIYAEHFSAHTIHGETKQSWLLGINDPFKVNKATLREAGKSGFHGYQWFTEQGREDNIWVHEHRHKIVQKVEREMRAPLLREIASVVGYEPR